MGFRAKVGLSGRVFIPNTLNCQEVDPPPAGGTVHQNERKVTLCWPGWGRAGEDTPPLISIRWCETSRGGVGTYNRRDGVFLLESCWGWCRFLASMRWNLLGVCLGKKIEVVSIAQAGFQRDLVCWFLFEQVLQTRREGLCRFALVHSECLHGALAVLKHWVTLHGEIEGVRSETLGSQDRQGRG